MSRVTITVRGPKWVSMARVLCDRILEEPFRPPGLSVTSRMVASLSISPAFRSVFDASVPGEGVGLENMLFVGIIGPPTTQKLWKRGDTEE